MTVDQIEQAGKPGRIPRSYDAIEKGALSLDLEERVNLRNKLTASIDDELKDMQEKLEKAQSIVNGK